jgi:hypothetical protein
MAIVNEEENRRRVEERLKEALRDFYGDEKVLIVKNMTKGCVSIGFGRVGSESGHVGYLIERSRLPINLTEKYPIEYWRDSPDFRQALAKGWLQIVSKEEYERAIEAERAHEARLAALAKNEQPRQKAHDVEINPLQEQVINERTAQLEPATNDPTIAAQVAEYERRLNEPPPPPVLKDGRSVRAEALVEKTRRGQITSLDALKELDSDADLYTDDDLLYISKHAEYESVKSFATSILTARRNPS